MEVLQKVAATLRLPELGGDPVAFTDPPKVTVTRHSDGSVVVEDQLTIEVDEGDDVYFTVDLTGAHLAEVDLLVAEWSDGDSSYTTYTEIVGGFAASLRAIRKKLDEDGPKAPSDDDYFIARALATRDIESACRVAFRPRYGKEVLNGSGTNTLQLRQPQLLRALSVTIDGEPIELGELTIDHSGFLIRASRWPEGQSNVIAAYIHGYENYPAASLPVIDLAAYLLERAPTDMNARAMSYTTGETTYSLVTAGVRGANFPVPSVNAFVQANEFPAVG